VSLCTRCSVGREELRTGIAVMRCATKFSDFGFERAWRIDAHERMREAFVQNLIAARRRMFQCTPHHHARNENVMEEVLAALCMSVERLA
jgi:hypothetical protein